ncbi:hypothetical protein, partial [Tautonia rosea]|uniref:hypothetical protein n=1 Tax=Tautonia rosea TaxID=2728037 RepID=UPI0019CF9B06
LPADSRALGSGLCTPRRLSYKCREEILFGHVSTRSETPMSSAGNGPMLLAVSSRSGPRPQPHRPDKGVDR